MNNATHAKDWRLVVAGCGSIGKRHIKNLQALGAREIFACDLRADRRAEVKAGLDIETVESLDDAWALEPDAIVIATPTSLHMPLALEAAERGVHLFVEKPLASGWASV
ncbi:MAG: Gfo/Idh/MocA family protein, partial [Candidatus Binatia bacterium]